jgi:chitin disaccharide deacetylase
LLSISGFPDDKTEKASIKCFRQRSLPVPAKPGANESEMILTMAGSQRFSFCLCADDFGLSPGVSRGILVALQAGRLTATSVMTTRPSWPEAAGELRAFQNVADVGLHLNLTLCAPLSPMPRFAPSNHLPRIGPLISAAARGRLPEAEIRAEILAQIDAFTTHFGRPPDFVDGHQHVHVLPAIRPWLFDALENRGLKGKVWLRDSGDRVAALLACRIELKKAFAVAWLTRGFAQAAAARGFQTNHGFAGFSGFDAGRDYGADFARYLVAPGNRHLVMCHPGFVDEALAGLDPVTVSRPKELEFLMSSRFEACLDLKRASLARLTPA